MSGKGAMGCQSSKSGGADNPPPPLTEDAKEKVRESWEWFTSDVNLSRNGVLIFVKLFELQPKTKLLFKFVGDSSSEEALMGNEKLVKHARGVTDAISTVVCSMDDKEAVIKALTDLGGRHYKYGVKTEYIGAVLKGVVYALQRTLKSKFTPEHEKAWNAVLGLIEHLFAKGLNSKES